MATANCLRCLARPSPTASIPRRVFATGALQALQASLISFPFSTSSRNNAAAKSTSKSASKSGSGQYSDAALSKHIRAGKQMTLNKKRKKKPLDRGKSPLPGERKAYRKRIVLRNDNALPVPGLQVMTPRAMVLESSAGTVMEIPPATVDQLRAVEAFKPTQTWGIFRQPATLIRAESVQLMRKMQDAAKRQETLRLVITGDRIAGKSTVLLQALAHAYLNDWVVFHIPEGQELTTACTEYSPIQGTKPVQYMQPNYALKMIQGLRKANEHVLSKLPTRLLHPDLSQHVSLGSPMINLANAAKEADVAWAVFHALWKELTIDGRPPILFSIDGLAHIMRTSDYRSPAFELIHSHDLALVRLFVDGLSGNLTLPNGGAFLSATSRGNAPRIPSMDLALSQREAEQLGKVVPQVDPYFRGYDARVDAALSSVQVLPTRSLTRDEARSLMEYWAASGVLLSRVDEAAVSEKWALGGNGIVGEMERAALLTMRL